MAVGFTPKHIEEFHLDEFNPEQFIVLAEEAAKEIGWEIDYLSKNGLIAHTVNGMFSWNADITIKIEYGIATIQSASASGGTMDWGKNKKNVALFIETVNQLKSSYTKELLDAKYLELREQLVSNEDDILMLPPASTSEQVQSFFSLFVPKKGFFITPILICLNVFIFILMVLRGANIMMPDNEILLSWGANFRPLTLEGEWWRLITNCFIHIGLFHLLMNMYALFYIGILLEPHLGKIRFLAAYLLTGIAASIISLWWHDLTISAGASGAIFGMYGIFLALLTTNLIDKKTRRALLASIAIFVGYNLIYGLKGNIDNAAHIGGLLSGAIIGYAFLPSLKQPEERKLKLGTIGLLAILILTSTFIIYKNIPNYFATYDSEMKRFATMESMALEVYRLPGNTPQDKILNEIKESGIYYWNESEKLLDNLQKLNLPPELKKRNFILKEYCELRIKSYELLYKAVAEDTDQYASQMEDYNSQIEAKIRELSDGNQQE